MRTNAADRFAAKTRSASNGCIEWTGATNGVGYGIFFTDWAGGKNLRQLAHRWAYEHHTGRPIPTGACLDRNTLCVNPAHLEPVSQRVNILRGTSPAAIHAQKTECINGHPFTGSNLIIRKNGGWRDCRECKRQKDRRRYRSKKRAG